MTEISKRQPTDERLIRELQKCTTEVLIAALESVPYAILRGLTKQQEAMLMQTKRCIHKVLKERKPN